ncbi:unnamed protein product [Callosobruchus maculatus]|uniref:Uncharacterized protein n=1 Tax=Callosobruchus maculatus TaxID=64391 RepID=A0A653BP13_CALMS|nr:unnamed protein product [Callosobruchus maculatus]
MYKTGGGLANHDGRDPVTDIAVALINLKALVGLDNPYDSDNLENPMKGQVDVHADIDHTYTLDIADEILETLPTSSHTLKRPNSAPLVNRWPKGRRPNIQQLPSIQLFDEYGKLAKLKLEYYEIEKENALRRREQKKYVSLFEAEFSVKMANLLCDNQGEYASEKKGIRYSKLVSKTAKSKRKCYSKLSIFLKQQRRKSCHLCDQEQSNTSKDERLAFEKSEVVKVLTHVTESVAVTNIRRLGKFDRNKTSARPVKVSLANAEQVSELIRKSQTLKNSDAFKDVFISTDKTPRHMDFYKAVRSDLEERKKKGETNIKIRHNVENSMDEQETEANEEDSLTGSAYVTGNGATYTDIQTGVDPGGTDSSKIVATTESASADKEGGIGNSTNRYQNHFKIPVGGVKKYKRKAVEMNETERRMEEAYEIMKQCRNAKPPKPTLCTVYGQLVATRLETLSEVNRIMMMNEIDNLFFRATMNHYQSAQYQSASPGPASPASANSFIHQPPQYQSASPGSASPVSPNSFTHQSPQCQSASPGPASPASTLLFIHQPPQYQSGSPGPASPASANSFIHQSP